MSKISIGIYVILFVLYLSSTLTFGAEVEQKRKEEDLKYSRLWFGPRVGRRKRNPNDEILRNLDNSDEKSLIDFIKKNPLTALLLLSGEPEGSKMTKEMTADARDDQIEELPRFSPYIPRLGRVLKLYSRANKENGVF